MNESFILLISFTVSLALGFKLSASRVKLLLEDEKDTIRTQHNKLLSLKNDLSLSLACLKQKKEALNQQISERREKSSKKHEDYLSDFEKETKKFAKSKNSQAEFLKDRLLDKLHQDLLSTFLTKIINRTKTDILDCTSDLDSFFDKQLSNLHNKAF
ncbi:MAG TPA: hypothetical protein VI959_00040 [Alphaproteobacteria bacterium]|nr:hypothetical protein [Alphaproteobacteria bacterium]